MKVFLSWSGNRSHAIANAWEAFIPCVIQSVRTFLSSSDLEAGARWGEGLDVALEEADIGILCLTQENISEPWILFEAGALAKRVGTARVVPFLLDLTPGQLKPPLGRFNAREFKREDVQGILGMIRNQYELPARLDAATFNRSFDAFYPVFEKAIKDIPAADPKKKPLKRNQEDMLEEMLNLLRRSHSSRSDRPIRSINQTLPGLGPDYRLILADFEDVIRVARHVRNEAGIAEAAGFETLEADLHAFKSVLRQFIASHSQYLPGNVAIKLANLQNAADTWTAQTLDGSLVFRKTMNIRSAIARLANA